MSARVASSGEILDVLREDGTFELLLRLLRGKPRTIERIREFAPGGVDLGASLTALERVGLVRVEPAGLCLEEPADVLVRTVTRELREQRESLARWRTVLTAYTESIAQTSMPGGTLLRPDAPLADDLEPVPPLIFAPGDASALWDQAFDESATEVRAAIPDLGRARRLLTEWLAQQVPTPALDTAFLLLPVRGLLDPGLRELVGQLSAAGAQLRLASTVPTWLVLAPSRPAVISAAPGDRPLSGTISTEAPVVVAGLQAAFESWWAKALPHPLTGNLASRSLALRALGLSDDEVAEVLEVSPRTLQRHLELLMRQIGARSRFQLGAWWTRHRNDTALFGPDPDLPEAESSES